MTGMERGRDGRKLEFFHGQEGAHPAWNVDLIMTWLLHVRCLGESLVHTCF